MSKQSETTDPKDRAYCKHCAYSAGGWARYDHLCMYILMTGKRRGCKPGVGCTRRKERKK